MSLAVNLIGQRSRDVISCCLSVSRDVIGCEDFPSLHRSEV